MIKKYKTTTIENPKMQYFEQLSRCCCMLFLQINWCPLHFHTPYKKDRFIFFCTLLYYFFKSNCHSQSQGSTVIILELEYPTSRFCKWTSPNLNHCHSDLPVELYKTNQISSIYKLLMHENLCWAVQVSLAQNLILSSCNTILLIYVDALVFC